MSNRQIIGTSMLATHHFAPWREKKALKLSIFTRPKNSHTPSFPTQDHNDENNIRFHLCMKKYGFLEFNVK
jgi:hypothetical protein